QRGLRRLIATPAEWRGRQLRQRLGTLGARGLAGRCPQHFFEPQRTFRVLTPSEPKTRQRRRQAEPGVCIAAIETPPERDAQVFLFHLEPAMSVGPRNAPYTPGCASAVHHATCRLWRMRASPEVCGGLLHNHPARWSSTVRR